MNAAFKVGDAVTWESQSAGRRAVKVGTVVAVVPRDTSPNRALRSCGAEGQVNAPGFARNHESYVVRATVEGRTANNHARLYWPRVAALRASK